MAADGYCRPFDEEACGYTRSEAIGFIYLQKAKDAKRVYANLLCTKTNCDGFKEEGITFPSAQIQKKLLKDFYTGIDFDPTKIAYIEAHSTGTVVGDPEECQALDEIFCAKRTTPLPVGSVKSNLGHTEATAGICSVAKIILAFETGLIPPNINFKSVRKCIPALVEGRLQVVIEPQPLEGDYISLSSFGFGGANCHALLKAHQKLKENNGEPSDRLYRLIPWSGRTEEAINCILDEIAKRPLDVEFNALLYSTQSESSTANVFRGYGVFSHEPGKNAVCVAKEITHYTGMKRPIVFVYSGMGSQWSTMGKDLLSIPIFREAVENCHRILLPKGINLMEIITSDDPKMFDNILNSFVGIAAVQIGITDILQAINLVPDFIIGHSVGELGCAYADGCFTAEQAILTAYSYGLISNQVKCKPSIMHNIGLSYKDIKKMLPLGIEVVYHNDSDSCTISGPAENITDFVAHLKTQGIFVKEVPCSNIPYHSSYISEMGPKLLAYLSDVIKKPVKRSSKWLSSSVPKAQWDQPGAQYSSAHYHTNNLLNSVLFEETAALLPNNALTIEIAPRGQLQEVLKKTIAYGKYIELSQDRKSNDLFFISSLGRYVFSISVFRDLVVPSI